MASETYIMGKIREVADGLPHVSLFRNNTGSFVLRGGRFFRAGLCKGSADLIGWITVDDRAIFLSVEVKKPGGRVDSKQEEWRNQVTSAGGLAMIVASVAEFKQAIQEYSPCPTLPSKNEKKPLSSLAG